MRIITSDDVASVLELPDLLPVVAEAFRKQGRNEVERPPQPSMDVGIGLDGSEPMGNVLVQPGYIHGDERFVIKLASVHEGNRERGLPTMHAHLVVADAATGEPAAYVHGTELTNAKTACVGGLAARELAVEPVDLAVIGAGTQARWQTRAIAETTDLRSVTVYSPSDSRERCAADLDAELDATVRAVDSAREAVTDASVVVTVTTATDPVFPGDALAPGTLVVAIGAYTPEMHELDARTFELADQVFATAMANVLDVGEVIEAGLTEADMVPFADVLEGRAGRRSDDEILVVESAGSAVLDAAAVEHLYRTAERKDVGTVVDF
ncbi:ornithine cyclodeaminase family protein [Haloarculaceae archaeon H-GB2-1]|nr:ornithine cyclodeaminase family protein [Haloarculaceae archaeon H-GB1-1]MEA5406333.1 ornithine cyclodeaminase family protein [Haloarculaceae archaeon H-GB2-1]